jgi:hypothetical protein
MLPLFLRVTCNFADDASLEHCVQGRAGGVVMRMLPDVIADVKCGAVPNSPSLMARGFRRGPIPPTFPPRRNPPSTPSDNMAFRTGVLRRPD